jgi:hypothetical protein|tara:strand:+ start:527 stop:1003 length:477 start_codon:yes stop_codon:yes gene_type:complete
MNINELEFFTQLLKTNSHNNGSCIEWTGKINAGGYGYIYAYKKSWLVHRIAFLLQNGHLPNDLYICHRCNNKKCINPEHIYAGTAKENAQDFKNSDYYHETMLKRKQDYIRYHKIHEDYLKAFVTIGVNDLKFLVRMEVEKYIDLLKISINASKITEE